MLEINDEIIKPRRATNHAAHMQLTRHAKPKVEKVAVSVKHLNKLNSANQTSKYRTFDHKCNDTAWAQPLILIHWF